MFSLPEFCLLGGLAVVLKGYLTLEASKRLQSDLDLLQNLPLVEVVDMIYIRYLEQLVKMGSRRRDLGVMPMKCEEVPVDEPLYILLGLFFFGKAL